jgi:solute carrier family 45, member 1/2/4
MLKPIHEKNTEVDSPVFDEYELGVDGVLGHEFRVRGASIPMLLLLSMPRMAIQAAWAAQWAALGPYLGTMLPKYAVQLTQVIGPLTGIIVSPMVGVLSDRSTNRWGRRRPFLLFAAIASVVCWIAMGYTRQMGELCGDYGTGKPGVPTSRSWTAFFTILFYTWMDITVNVVQTPAFLLVADFAGDRQTTGAALGQGWSTLGMILVSSYIEIWGAAHLTLHYFLGMLAVVMIVTIGVVCVFAKEEPLAVEEVDQESVWKRIGEAFYSIYKGLKTLPSELITYCLVFFCVVYGYTAYNGNKGQFFGIEVYGGDPQNADKCQPNCTEAQDNYNKGVRMAGGLTDLLISIVGYLVSWAIPFLVHRIGAKWTLTMALVPQSLLTVMAFSDVVPLNIFIVVVTSFSQTTIFALLVPVIIHVLGDDAEIGMYVGALNSANCFGQLLNFFVGAALVETSLGYKLPIFIGGITSLLGIFTSMFFLRIKMYSI